MKKTAITTVALLSTIIAFAQENIIINSPVSPTPGFNNVMIGIRQPLKNSNKRNVIIGYDAASSADSIEHNVVIGTSAGNGGVFRKLTSSVVIGNGTGQDNRGSNVVLIGQSAGKKNISPGNIFIGSEAGQNYQGESSVIIGRFAVDNSKAFTVRGRGATYIGHEVALEDSLSSGGTYIGFRTGMNFRNGDSNTFIGSAAGSGGTDPNFARGNFNTFLGNNAGGLIRKTNENVLIGYRAGFLMSEGKGNVIIGTNAGSDPRSIVANVFEGLVLMGNNAQAKNGLHNAGAIGNNARVDTSNALVLGNADIHVGIGTTNPKNRLEIVSETANSSGLRLTKLTAQSPTVGTSAKYLSVNDEGDIVLMNNTPTDITAVLNRLTVLETTNTNLLARVKYLESRRCFVCFHRKQK